MCEINNFFKIIISSCKCMQLEIICKYICVYGFDCSINPILLKIDIHVQLQICAFIRFWNSWMYYQPYHALTG